jgi:hypothetical protein
MEYEKYALDALAELIPSIIKKWGSLDSTERVSSVAQIQRIAFAFGQSVLDRIKEENRVEWERLKQNGEVK